MPELPPHITANVDQAHDYATPDLSGLLPGFVTGGLVAHVINNLLRDDLPDHEARPEDNSCCPRCCAPCVSLLWLRDNAPTWTARVVHDAVEGGWDWQNDDGTINWGLISARWEHADQMGCHDTEADAEEGTSSGTGGGDGDA